MDDLIAKLAAAAEGSRELDAQIAVEALVSSWWRAMSRLAELQNELQEIAAAIARAERTVAAHPDVPSVLATLQTAQARRQNLEDEFLVVANELELDVCSYRIERADRAVRLASFGKPA